MKRAADWEVPVFKVVGFVEVRVVKTGNLMTRDRVKLYVVAGTRADAVSICEKYLFDSYVGGMSAYSFRAKLSAVVGVGDHRWVIVRGGSNLI